MTARETIHRRAQDAGRAFVGTLHRLRAGAWWRDVARRSSSALMDLLLPPACVWCEAAIEQAPQGIMLCPPCQQALCGTNSQRCPRCAGALATAGGACVECHGRKFHFDAVVALGAYQAALRDAVLRLKKPHHDALARAVATLVVARRNAELAELDGAAIIPVPMYWSRRLIRRTNSPELLASALGEELGLPCWPHAVRRVRATRQQGPMLRTQRLENVRGAFQFDEEFEVRGKSLLVVDDVLTTGATADELAKVLKHAGAARVSVVVLARASSPH